MLEKMLVDHCAPTLAGLKTGSLFAWENGGGLYGELSRVNNKLSPKGLRVVPLSVNGERALVYAYRPKKLREDLTRDGAAEILSERGYSIDDPAQCIRRLRERLEGGSGFPHEIGLFLGYPPEDVSGFISKCPCKFTGAWKVYGDADAARALFDRYRRCTIAYSALLDSGTPIEYLTVSDGAVPHT